MTFKPLTLIAAAALLAATQATVQAGPTSFGPDAVAAPLAGQDDVIGYHRHGHTNCGHCQGNQGR